MPDVSSGSGISSVNDIPVSLGGERVELSDEVSEWLHGIVVELKVISHLLNEGLNTKEDLETLRIDLESE
jgi:hypothetical protein